MIVIERPLTVCFDTNIFDRIRDDPAHTEIVTSLTTRLKTHVTMSNLDQIYMIEDSRKRKVTLDVVDELVGSQGPILLPFNECLHEVLMASRGESSATVSRVCTLPPLRDKLDGGAVDTERKDAREHHRTNWKVHKGIRCQLADLILPAERATPARSVGRVLEAARREPWAQDAFTYLQSHWKDETLQTLLGGFVADFGGSFEQIQATAEIVKKEPAWFLFGAAFLGATFQNVIKSRKFFVESTDVDQLVYLAAADIYVTDDGNLQELGRHVVRFAHLKAVVTNQSVLSYNELKQTLGTLGGA